MKVTTKDNVKRGDIVWVDLGEYYGSLQGGIRPAIILQNNMGNYYSPTVILAAITSQNKKENQPTHVPIGKNGTGLHKNSVIMLEQIRTVNKFQILGIIGSATQATLEKVEQACNVSLGF